MNQRNLHEVDWSKIPAPVDDGGAAHLAGLTIPPISLRATDDTTVTLSSLPDRTVVFAYPRTGEPVAVGGRSQERKGQEQGGGQEPAHGGTSGDAGCSDVGSE